MSSSTEEDYGNAFKPAGAEKEDEQLLERSHMSASRKRTKPRPSKRSAKTVDSKEKENASDELDSEEERLFDTGISEEPVVRLLSSTSNRTRNSYSTERVIIMRHAERMDRVFPAWIRLAVMDGRYSPYNLNQPQSLPQRHEGVWAFHNDPPITEIGRTVASLIGHEIASKYQITAIYTSPSLRCVQTAGEIAKIMAPRLVDIYVEYGLFEWLHWYEDIPIWMTEEEFCAAGIPINSTYNAIVTKEMISMSGPENKNEYYRRTARVVSKIMEEAQGTILIVAHGPTLDATARWLLGLGCIAPSSNDLDKIGLKYPYCSSVVIEEETESGNWKMGDPVGRMTTTFGNISIDERFLLRN